MKPQLKFLDRYLTLWIFLAMAAGLAIGHFFPSWPRALDRFTVGPVNLPLALGLILMMYPPLAKVDYALIPGALADRKAVAVSLWLNWLVGPLLMFILAVGFLREQPHYMVGLILIGLARCIAMVIVWNDLAGGNRTYAAMLVALNSLFQLLAYGVLAWLFIEWLPERLQISEQRIDVPMETVVSSVFWFLGVPFLLAFFGKKILEKTKGPDWYRRVYLPRVSPFTLYALLLTIVYMFSLKGKLILKLPHDVLLIATPLLVYFLAMFVLGFALCWIIGLDYGKNAAISFTATGNNFELAIAVGIAVYGIDSPQAFVGVIGPLVEVPAMILLVRLSLFLKKRLYPTHI